MGRTCRTIEIPSVGTCVATTSHHIICSSAHSAMAMHIPHITCDVMMAAASGARARRLAGWRVWRARAPAGW